MSNEIALRPSYWASVSGGKDSLYMLNLILHNLDKYPLDGVVHFELEIDYPFVTNVVKYMESECNKYGIPFFRIKPRKSWNEWYKKYGFPTRVNRWCNNVYKLDAKKQLEEFLNSKGFYSVHYIGYCVDEEKRYNKRFTKNGVVTEVYPLVENNIEESLILEWAKTQPLFNDYYKFNRRGGCMYCPMASYIEKAYLLKYYPDKYFYMINKIKETEQRVSSKLNKKYTIKGNDKYDAEYQNNIIHTKWLPKLEEMLKKIKE